MGDKTSRPPASKVGHGRKCDLVYELKEAPKTSQITILAAVFPSMTNERGSKLKIYYDDIFSKTSREFIVKQMRRVGIEVYAATDQLVTCKGSQWERYAIAVAKRANATVEVHQQPTGETSYRFRPDLETWTCIDSHRITFMRHNKIEKRFERLRVKDVDDKYAVYQSVPNQERRVFAAETQPNQYDPLRIVGALRDRRGGRRSVF